MAEFATDKELLDAASKKLVKMRTALRNLPNAAGCELLLRKGRPVRDPHGGWRKVDASGEFSIDLRKKIQKTISDASNLDLTLLEYGATSAGERLGVLLKEELEEFFDRLPPRAAAPKFDLSIAELSNQDKKCVHISLQDQTTLSAFGPSGANFVGRYARSKMLAIWSEDKEIQYPSADIFEIGDTINSFALGRFVFVIDEDGFSAATGYREVTKVRAREALQELVDRKFISISDPAVLESLCEDSPDFAKRISASSARGFIKGLTKSGLKNVLKDFTKELRWSEVGDRVHIQTDFKNAEERKAFKQLISQVFVYCAATKKKLKSYSSEPL